jgi:hypothetical protein
MSCWLPYCFWHLGSGVSAACCCRFSTVADFLADSDGTAAVDISAAIILAQVGIDNSKSIDSLLIPVLIFVTNLFDNCIILCLSYSIIFYKFIGLKINVAIILNKSLPEDFYAMFLTFIEFPTIIA